MSKIGLGVIGLGYIFKEYLKVISMIKDYEIIGGITKSNIKAKNFAKLKSNFVVYNDLNEMMSDYRITAVLVLVNPQETFNVLKKIIPYQKFIFVEKPIGLNFNETKKIKSLFLKYKTPNMIGFNRRFYSVFKKGLKIINSKGGVHSILIEGHERFWKVDKKRNKKILDNWVYANSSHTIDLLRFFGGEFNEVYSFKKTINEKNGDNFTMILKSKKNILATYISNWYSPGGWSVKLFGNGITVVFDPLENGYILNKKFEKKYIEPSNYDKDYKPGFYQQMIFFKSLIKNNKLSWPAQDIVDAFKTVSLIKKILK